MIPPSPLTDFSEEQLEMYIYEIRKLEDKADEEFLFIKSRELMQLRVQLMNALGVKKEQNKIYQS